MVKKNCRKELINATSFCRATKSSLRYFGVSLPLFGAVSLFITMVIIIIVIVIVIIIFRTFTVRRATILQRKYICILSFVSSAARTHFFFLLLLVSSSMCSWCANNCGHHTFWMENGNAHLDFHAELRLSSTFHIMESRNRWILG